jgi:FemAB family
MVRSTKWGVRIADFHFDEPEAGVSDVDVIRYIQKSRPVPDIESTPFSTILIDLTPDEGWLIAHVRNNTRYEIARARDRDALEYRYWYAPDANLLNEFSDFFDRSAILKNQPRVSRSRLRVLAHAGVLDLSVVKGEGNDIVWHADLRAGKRARLLETASLFRASADAEYKKLVARANRYHHWRDMMRFKSEGISIYDFGGCAPNATSPELIGINRFKEGFGGRLVTEYHAEKAVTLRGKIALALVRRRVRLQTSLIKPTLLKNLGRP